jgi:histidinol-phosphatase
MHLKDQDEALCFAWNVADTAESIFDENRHGVAVEMKPDDTPVTAVDRAIEQMVVDQVRSRRPGEQVLGEEGLGNRALTGEPVWVVDPIDGTEAFVADVPGYVFSMALVVDGQPQVALVRDPVTGDTWTAMLGRGARFTAASGAPSRRMKVSWNTALFDPLPKQTNREWPWPVIVSTVDKGTITTLKFGSVIRAGLRVVDGEIDALIFGSPSPWDMASLALLVSEAGGNFTDLFGQDQRLDRRLKGAIVSNGLVHDDLVQLIADSLR